MATIHSTYLVTIYSTYLMVCWPLSCCREECCEWEGAWALQVRHGDAQTSVLHVAHLTMISQYCIPAAGRQYFQRIYQAFIQIFCLFMAATSVQIKSNIRKNIFLNILPFKIFFTRRKWKVGLSINCLQLSSVLDLYDAIVKSKCLSI